MKRYPWIILVIFIELLGGVAPTFGRPKDEIRATAVAGTVHLLTSHGRKPYDSGNIAISVGEDGVLMVDSKIEPLSPIIKAKILEIAGTHPKFVINTHFHRDHTEGNSGFRSEGIIVAHTNVRHRLKEEKPREIWPVVTFDQGLSVHFNGEEIKVLHYPKGHTDGDAVVFFTRSKVVHLGDLYFSGIFPYIDLDSGGSVSGYIANIEKLIADLPTEVKIIPGHGPLSTMEDLKAYRDMLKQTAQYVDGQKNAGKALVQIQREGLPEIWESWSWRFITTDRWIETLYHGGLRK